MTGAGGRSRTVYNTAVSADGYIADANGSLDWLQEVPRTADVDRFSSFLAEVGAFAMGATTYEWVLRNEHVLDRPGQWAEWYGDLPCWVFTHRDLPAVPGADVRFVSGSAGAVHEEMARTAGDRLVWIAGGGVLAAQFAEAGLLDEIVLGIAPVMLGGGTPVLPAGVVTRLRQAGSPARFGEFVELRYHLVAPSSASTPAAGGRHPTDRGSARR